MKTIDLRDFTLDELADLSKEVAGCKKELARNLVAEKAEPYISKILGKITIPEGVEYSEDDVKQEARYMVIYALDNYDIESDAKFSTYMYIRVRGKIIQYFRKHDPLTRSQRKKAGQLRKKKHEFEQKHGRFPTSVDMRRECGEDSPLGYENARQTSSLDSEDSTHRPLADKPLESKFEKDYILDRLKYLSVRERVIIIGYYFFGMSGKELALLFDITRKYIYMLKSKALEKLKG